MRNSAILIIEIIWIVAGILCTVAAIRSAQIEDKGKTILFALMAVVSIVFAVIRHSQRKKN